MSEKKDVYEYVSELFAKKKNENNESDVKRIMALEKFFSNKTCFFDTKMETSLKILFYLGVPKEKLREVYLELVSPDNFQKRTPQIRTILPGDVGIDEGGIGRNTKGE